jgi:hypothetical protein
MYQAAVPTFCDFPDCYKTAS